MKTALSQSLIVISWSSLECHPALTMSSHGLTHYCPVKHSLIILIVTPRLDRGVQSLIPLGFWIPRSSRGMTDLASQVLQSL